MSRLVVAGGGPVRGSVRVPGDKSISHRALMIAALADGTSMVRGLSDGDDVDRTRRAVVALGATVEGERIEGGRDRLHEPGDVLDVGNSGTTMRLLAGICAWLPGLTVLTGDRSIRRRPMGRVAGPLRAMGATVVARAGDLAPLAITGGPLRAGEHELAVPSAQVKSAVLLAGLGAEGETVVRGSPPTRAHTEELLAAAGADLAVEDGGRVVRLRPSDLRAFELDVAGDPSQAAFWLVAAAVVPGSEVEVVDVYRGPGRTGFLDVLARMGADVAPAGERGLVARHRGPLRATTVGAGEIPGLVDEVPVLAVAAALADGTTVFQGVGELRVKESDRLATMTAGLAALGVRAGVEGDDLWVEGTGGRPLAGGAVSSAGDHRVAMALAVAGLAGAGDTAVEGWDAVATSYPRFAEDLAACRS